MEYLPAGMGLQTGSGGLPRLAGTLFYGGHHGLGHDEHC